MARVGVPAFSINEGIKFAGHPEEWGEAHARDYVDHRYHQSSDDYSPDMDFAGDAIIAKFGFMLGFRACVFPEVIGWIPGDEFAGARKSSQQ